MNGKQRLDMVRGELDASRISKERRENIDLSLRLVGRFANHLPVQVANIPCPAVDPEDYYGKMYWQGKDPLTARAERPATVTARAVSIDMPDPNGRTPSSWRSVVEVSVDAEVGEHGEHTVSVGDISPFEARRVAMALLAAAELADRGY